MQNSIEEVLNYFPNEIKDIFQIQKEELDKIEEIHIRTNRNILLKIGQDEKRVNYTITTKEILEILQRICDNSIYTYQSQICNGFITIKGGHRVRNHWQCSI